MSTPTAENPFDIERDGIDWAVVDKRDGQVIEYAEEADVAQAIADRMWLAELRRVAPIAVEPQTPEDAEIAAFWQDYDAKRAAADPEYAAWIGAAPTPELAPTLNALSEPMPASADEALARQLVNELNEMQTLAGAYDQRRYDAKSAQVRQLGFEIGPDKHGALTLWHADNTGPLADQTPSPPALASCRVALSDGTRALVDDRGVIIGIEQAISVA